MNTTNVKIEVSPLVSAEREVFGHSQNTTKPEVTETTYSVKDVFDELKASLKEHYGIEDK